MFSDIKKKGTQMYRTFDSKIDRKYPKLVYLAVYSFICMVTFFLCFFWFYKLHRSFMWNVDGLYTHYNFLAYMGEYLRTCIRNFLHGNFSIPAWDFSLGYGVDIITTLYARFGDPLNYLSVFFSRENTELLHNFLAVLRIYLAGLSFSAYCFYHKRDRYSTLIGSLIYCFCGVVFWAGVRHLYFMTPMMYFPLLVLGAEKILNKEKPYLFTIMVFLSAISNFYFFYMMTILVFVFTVITYFLNYKNITVKAFFQLLGRFILYYVIGVALSLFLFLPVVITYMTNARLGSSYEGSLLFRSASYYIEFIVRWFSQGSEYGEATGYCVLALICVVGLFLIRKKYLELKVKFIVLTVFLLIPFFGYALNGFGYVTNRWVFGYSFLVAYIAAVVTPNLQSIFSEKKNQRILCVLCLGILGWCMLFSLLQNKIFLSAVALLIGTAFVICVMLKKNAKVYNGILILAVCIVTLWANGSGRFSPFKGDYISEYITYGTAELNLTDTPASVLPDNETDFYRVDENDGRYNTTVAQGYNGLSFYTSLLNHRVDEFHQLLGVNNLPTATVYNYKGVNKRAFLEASLSTKYYVTTPGDTQIPYGFEKVEQVGSDGRYALYQNKNFLPLGYTYDSYMTSEEFEQLPLAKRQEALLETAVIDGETDVVEKSDLTYTSTTPEYTITYGDGVEQQGNSFVVTKSNAKITFSFDGAADSETYLQISGLDITTYTPKENYERTNEPGIDVVKDEKVKYQNQSTAGILTLKCGDFTNKYKYRTSGDRYYSGVRDYFVNMGYSEEGKTGCSLAFSTPGVYSFDEVKIVCQPMAVLSDYTNQRREDVLENTTVTDRTVEGTIDLEKNKILYLSVQDNGGWTIYVDGEKAEYYTGNIMGISIPLEAGHHTIKLVYHTPGMKPGTIISVLTALLCLGYMGYRHYRKRRQGRSC